MLVAGRLKQASRDSDVAGRLGGDEFLIVLREIPGAEEAMRAAERICEALCDTFGLSVARWSWARASAWPAPTTAL